jgi:hypothetical protein
MSSKLKCPKAEAAGCNSNIRFGPPATVCPRPQAETFPIHESKSSLAKLGSVPPAGTRLD